MTALQPLVTALVPSYNHGRYIKERIESILQQTYPAVELIVIDDMSEDHSDEVILALQRQYGFLYIRNTKNSGTPFAAWERVRELASGEYIWVCESDDVADPEFLQTAVQRMKDSPRAVLFYCQSLVINDLSEVIGSTEEYFHDIWRENRWDEDFSVDGTTELLNFQMRGQIVPNMSSALIAADAFHKGFTPFLKKLRLTGDWLFIGTVIRQGDVEFCSRKLSRFRKHQVTSRVRVKSARSQAEFILTKYHLFKATGQPTSQFAHLMGTDVVRFLYESASWLQVSMALLEISAMDTLRCFTLLLASLVRNPDYVEKFLNRYKIAKVWRSEHE
jgi:glycosyltransferase involved in cell wall biosynthesis